MQFTNGFYTQYTHGCLLYIPKVYTVPASYIYDDEDDSVDNYSNDDDGEPQNDDRIQHTMFSIM